MEWKYHPTNSTAASFTRFIIASILLRRIVERRRCTPRPQGGSQIGTAPNREIGRELAVARLTEAFFLESTTLNPVTNLLGPTFQEEEFERRFRMPRAVYETIKTAVQEEYSFFKQGEDCTGKKSSSTNQGIVAAILQLSCGVVLNCRVSAFGVIHSSLQAEVLRGCGKALSGGVSSLAKTSRISIC